VTTLAQVELNGGRVKAPAMKEEKRVRLCLPEPPTPRGLHSFYQSST